MMWLVLDIHSIWNQSTIGPHRLVDFTIPLGKAPFAADVYLKQVPKITYHIIMYVQVRLYKKEIKEKQVYQESYMTV